MYRHFIGTSSATTQNCLEVSGCSDMRLRELTNDCWKATAMPMKTSAAMRVLTFLAVAPIMEPINAMIDPMMKNLLHMMGKEPLAQVLKSYHRLPKMSDNCPTIKKKIAPPARFTRGTQLMLGSGPISSLIWLSTGAIKP